MKVLVAEDDKEIQEIVVNHLATLGATVQLCHNGREAIYELDRFDADIIITDIVMPYTSGLELLGIIKQKTNKKVPVIVLSAIDEEDTVMIAFKLGADDFITKPFEPQELTLRLKRLLQLHQKVA